MKTKLHLLLIFGVGSIAGINAQTTKPQVFASGGKTATAGGVQVAYTIGEPMTKQFNAGNLILTQGFHQPINGSSAGIAENFNPSIEVFPNPTIDEVKVILPENIGNYTMNLYNQEGKIVRTITSSESLQKISLGSEAAASYYLQITGASFNNQYTIIKTN